MSDSAWDNICASTNTDCDLAIKQLNLRIAREDARQDALDRKAGLLLASAGIVVALGGGLIGKELMPLPQMFTALGLTAFLLAGVGALGALWVRQTSEIDHRKLVGAPLRQSVAACPPTPVVGVDVPSAAQQHGGVVVNDSQPIPPSDYACAVADHLQTVIAEKVGKNRNRASIVQLSQVFFVSGLFLSFLGLVLALGPRDWSYEPTQAAATTSTTTSSPDATARGADGTPASTPAARPERNRGANAVESTRKATEASQGVAP